MASSKEYLDYILEQTNKLKLTVKRMMGEFLLYYKNTLFGGIYDDRLLVKKTITNNIYDMEESIPYEGAKPMYLVSEIDNKELLCEIIINTYNGLKK